MTDLLGVSVDESLTVSVKGGAYVSTTFLDIQNEMKTVPFLCIERVGGFGNRNFETRN